MKGMKESEKTGFADKQATTAADTAMTTESRAEEMEICHGSVCIGNQKPTHCICPTDKK